MPIDTWDKLIGLPNPNYVAVVVGYPAAHYECGSGWTSEGSSTYSHACDEEKVVAVTDDGQELTERSDVATVKANAGSYYFDFYGQKLYVRVFDDDDLSNSNTTVVVLCYVVKAFSTDAREFDGVQCRPIVRQDSLPNMDLSVDDIVEGIYKFNFGSFSMNNDGWFDTAADCYIWFNKKILIYLGGESLPDSEFCLYFVGRISDMEISDHNVMFSVKDIRVGTFANIPQEHYWLADYKFLDKKDDGKVKPIWYGEKAWIIPVCIKPFDDTNFRAVADDGGSMTTETTEALDTTEDDMTLLPASPAVDDAYYFGQVGNKFGKIHLLLGQAGVGTWEIVWEYWNGAAWKNLDEKHELRDGTDGFTEDSDEWHTIEFNRPGNWVTTSINSITAYWVRARVSSFTSLSTQPLGTMCKLDATVDSRWKLAGHEINDILHVNVNGLDKTSSITKYLTLAEFVYGGFFDTDNDVMEVHGEGKKVSGAYITKGASIAKDILKSYLSFLDIDLDLTSFSDTDSVRTHPLGIFIDTEESSREVLQTISRSIIAFFAPTEGGKLSFEAYEPTVPVGTLELFEADYFDDWKVVKDHKFVRQKVILMYDQDPKTQDYKIVERVNTDVDSKYSIKEPLELKTYVKNDADAITICEGVRDMCSKPITVASTSIGMKGFKLFPTRKVKMTKARAADASGSFNAKVFRIRTVSKDTGTERTHIVAMDDLQTLGESFCYVCFACQICVSEEASCTNCYACEICYTTQAGCQVCDTCQLCVTDEGGCQVCYSPCQVCDTCQSTVGLCPTCEDCVSCELCNLCQSNVSYCSVCQVCYGCDTCDNCQIAVTCVSCDSCQNCNACMVCNTTQDCTSCDVCNTCELNVTCGSCDNNCQVCVGCQNCYTTYTRCTICQECVSCQLSFACGSCQTCQLCNNCMNCFTSQNCAGCDVCVSTQVPCSWCNDCENCFACEQFA